MRLLLISSILSIVSCCICSIGYIKTKRFICYYKEKEKPSTNDIVCFVVLVMLCYAMLATLLMQSWVQGDEWHFLNRGKLEICEAVRTSWQTYLSWVSRIGEIGAGVLGLSLSRWQEWLLTPLFTVLAPMAVFSLVRKNNSESLWSKKGKMFYVVSFILFLLSVYLPRWRNYWCYAAAWNYLYPSVCLMYFLSIFRCDARHSSSIVKCCLCAGLGVISGWGTECTTVVIFPILTFIVIFNLLSKKSWLPFSSYCGYCGYMWGSAALFCSPALFKRAISEAASKGIDIAALSQNEYRDFILHLNWDKVLMLKGSSGIISLKEIPLYDRVYFWPFLSERFLQCSGFVLFMFALFLVVYCLIYKNSVNRKFLFLSTVPVCIAILFAFSYSVQCIPTHMSFLPSGFAIVAACMFIFSRFDKPIVSHVFCCLITLIGLSIFVPSGLQAARYKHLDTRRIAEIQLAKADGFQDIEITPPVITLWCPTLGMIAANDIKNDQAAYPNPLCARYFGIESVRQPKALIRKSSVVPGWIFPENDRKLFNCAP